MNILVIGGGFVGENLAVTLAAHGHDVAVLDKQQENIDRLKSVFDGLTYVGVPIDGDVLKEAGIASCDALCAVTGDENTNIMAAQLAKKAFNVPTVLARVLDRTKGEVFEKFGVHTVNSTALVCDAFLSALDDYGGERYVRFGAKQAKFYRVKPPKSYIGRRVSSIECEEGEALYGVIDIHGAVRLAGIVKDFILDDGDTLIYSKII
ncbi:MAG: TrkA family potassium uptake protein [Oscillospiraceae bacterium]|jgi:trk system potassium uptake protein TrkA|nr:TrkA family potassium uptake protein [Oscillospiraceae bacterium]